VENSGDFNGFFPHSVNNEKWQTSDRDLTCTGLAADPAAVWHVSQAVNCAMNQKRCAPSLCISEEISV